jgi:glycosyltransferase involved in cell wall biosynthesis
MANDHWTRLTSLGYGLEGLMGEAPTVSIVVNNYNYGRFLRQAIDSALAQTYPAVEVVVVDDGSTDDSRAIIASYGDRIVPVLKANGGMASAINVGFAATRGEILIFLDADDALFAEAAERVVAAWRPGVAKVQYRLQILDARGCPQDAFSPPASEPMPNGDLRGLILSRFTYVAPAASGSAYGRGALERLIPVPEAEWRLSVDFYLNILAPFHGDVVSMDEPLGYYRLHGENNWICFKPSLEERLVQDVAQALHAEALVSRSARESGLEAPRDLSLRHTYHVILRMALRVIDPARYPRPGERTSWLALKGLRATWRAPAGPDAARRLLGRRLALTTWFLLLPFLPGPLARRLAAETLVCKRGSQYRVRAAAAPGPLRSRPPRTDAAATACRARKLR